MKTVNLNSVTLKKNGVPIDLMGVTDAEKWEAINEITLTEDVTTFEINKDSSGEPFELKEILVYTFYPSGITAGYNYLQINNCTRLIIRSGTERHSTFHAIANGLFINQESSRGDYENTLSTHLKVYPFSDSNNIKSLKATVYSTAIIPSGTRFRIYGIRA